MIERGKEKQIIFFAFVKNYAKKSACARFAVADEEDARLMICGEKKTICGNIFYYSLE